MGHAPVDLLLARVRHVVAQLGIHEKLSMEVTPAGCPIRRGLQGRLGITAREVHPCEVAVHDDEITFRVIEAHAEEVGTPLADAPGAHARGAEQRHLEHLLEVGAKGLHGVVSLRGAMEHSDAAVLRRDGRGQ